MATAKQLAALKSFKPGQSGNPGGKPVNARNRLTKTFLEKLADDFEKSGVEAIEVTRTEHPDRYLAIVASLLPKEFIIDKPLDGLSDDELASAIALIRELAGRTDGAGSGAGDAPQSEPSGPLSSVH